VVHVRGSDHHRSAAADSTPPTVGTLAGSSITSSGLHPHRLRCASDETALHATPYRFSTDNGATYSAYQSSAVYAATGLDRRPPATPASTRPATQQATPPPGPAVVVTTGVAATGLVATYTGNASNGTPTNPHTFTAAAIGTAAADRHVIVAATWSTAASVTNITGITVGGVAATIDATYYNATGPRGCTIARAAVPTGTTANVVVTMSGAVPSRLGVGTWAVTGAPSLALVDNDAAMFTDAADLTPPRQPDSTPGSHVESGVLLSCPPLSRARSSHRIHAPCRCCPRSPDTPHHQDQDDPRREGTVAPRSADHHAIPLATRPCDARTGDAPSTRDPRTPIPHAHCA
jgi:hypothetical protein